MALNYDKITAIIKDEYIPNVVDNIFESSALLSTMLQNGRNISAAGKMTTSVNGGTNIIQPLKYKKSTAVGNYSNYDVVDITPQDPITALSFQMKNYYVSVTISHDDQLKIAGSDKATVNLITELMDHAKESLKDQIASDLYTGSGASGIIGLDTAIDSAGVYGGIDSAVYTWHQSGKDTTAHTGANMVDSTSTSYLPTLLANGWKSAKHKNMPPDFIFCSQDVWDIAEEVSEGFSRFTKPVTGKAAQMASLGFSVIDYRNIPMVVDDFIDDTTDAMYMGNTNFMTLYYHPENNFDFTGFKESVNQPKSKVGQITFTCQLAVSNRRHFYRWTDLNN